MISINRGTGSRISHDRRHGFSRYLLLAPPPRSYLTHTRDTTLSEPAAPIPDRVDIDPAPAGNLRVRLTTSSQQPGCLPHLPARQRVRNRHSFQRHTLIIIENKSQSRC